MVIVLTSLLALLSGICLLLIIRLKKVKSTEKKLLFTENKLRICSSRYKELENSRKFIPVYIKEKNSPEDENTKSLKPNDSVSDNGSNTEKNQVAEETLKNLIDEKSKLEESKTKLDAKVKKLWATSVAVYKEKERINALKEEIENQKNLIEKEKERSEQLLLNILPAEVADELKNKGSAEARQIEDVTVIFTDFKDFTRLSEIMSPHHLVNEIHNCFSAFDEIMIKNGVEKIKTIGDSYMAAGGIPLPNSSHALDVMNAAMEIKDFMETYKARKQANNELFFEIRIGVHTGPVVAGIVGLKKFAYDIWGDTVNTASRMESSGDVGKVNISGNTYNLIKDLFKCTYRGKIEVKGKGEIEMYYAERNQ
jgi:class 3 adenylate cyclase